MQRKRHINFKYWKNKIRSSTLIYSIQKKLHSIPIINKVKSNVLYSIPCVKSCAHTFCGAKSNSVFVILCLGVIGLISLMGGDKCSAATSASLSLSNPNMTSSAITPGSTATVSTNVTVSVDNADSYSLSLKVDSTTLHNGSTTIVPGNPNDDTKTNVWGYKWDNTSTYTTPSTSGTTLTNSTLVPLDSNGAVSFTKNLTFGAKFSASAEAGHYKGSGILSLVATPRKVAFGGISKMQEMTATICAAAEVGDSATLIDERGPASNNSYLVQKMIDNRCWMGQNLRLTGITITSANSHVTSSYAIPNSMSSDNWGSSSTTNNAMYSSEKDTAYYSWYAATAGTNPSSSNATSDICPKGWRLPTGGENSEYQSLINAYSSNDGKIALYRFFGSNSSSYVGYFFDAPNPRSASYWWSSTPKSSTDAYDFYNFYYGGVYVLNTTMSLEKYAGFAVRCIAVTSNDDGYHDVYE